MVDDVLGATKSLGLKVIRIWAYLDRGSLDGTVRNVDGAGEKGGVYFQYWDPAAKRPAYNDGPTGLEHLDNVLDNRFTETTRRSSDGSSRTSRGASTPATSTTPRRAVRRSWSNGRTKRPHSFDRSIRTT
jgi:hypothetical protein